MDRRFDYRLWVSRYVVRDPVGWSHREEAGFIPKGLNDASQARSVWVLLDDFQALRARLHLCSLYETKIALVKPPIHDLSITING